VGAVSAREDSIPRFGQTARKLPVPTLPHPLSRLKSVAKKYIFKVLLINKNKFQGPF
jgi:hypothetical protein